MSFSLDPRLAADTRLIGDLPLCRALLMNDARFAWLILVPRRGGLVEITDLDAGERAQLIEEAARAAEALRGMPEVEKINVGALGNIVRQLHMHVVGRSAADAAWPGPVWGCGPAIAYEESACEQRLEWLKGELKLA